ncbi:MAG: 2-iminobutanoate/2-iminopropanoate deaminase [Planctomycetota bacterium]|jgi:2-iminobutanoate/2-iminopropanoate deaminase
MSTERTVVSTSAAPAAIGPYNQAIIAGGLVHCSGQIAMDPDTGEIVSPDVRAQAQRALENLGAVLAAAGSGFDRVLKCNVFLADMGDFAVVNEIYATFFPDPAPARACVEVARLPKDARVEFDCVAQVG